MDYISLGAARLVLSQVYNFEYFIGPLWVAGLGSGAEILRFQDLPKILFRVPGGGPGSDVTHIPGYSWPL